MSIPCRTGDRHISIHKFGENVRTAPDASLLCAEDCTQHCRRRTTTCRLHRCVHSTRTANISVPSQKRRSFPYHTRKINRFFTSLHQEQGSPLAERPTAEMTAVRFSKYSRGKRNTRGMRQGTPSSRPSRGRCRRARLRRRSESRFP